MSGVQGVQLFSWAQPLMVLVVAEAQGGNEDVALMLSVDPNGNSSVRYESKINAIWSSETSDVKDEDDDVVQSDNTGYRMTVCRILE